MICYLCKRIVRDQPFDKIQHLYMYHIEVLISKVSVVPDIARVFGETLGDMVKGKIDGLKNS